MPSPTVKSLDKPEFVWVAGYFLLSLIWQMASEKIGRYLCTWMMHFTVEYAQDCVISQMGFDTFGSTAVSTPHNALDQYALRDVLSFLRLYEITGNIQWRERALALWCGANQCISNYGSLDFDFILFLDFSYRSWYPYCIKKQRRTTNEGIRNYALRWQ